MKALTRPAGAVALALTAAVALARAGTDPGTTYCTAKPFAFFGCVSTLSGAGVPSASAASGFVVTVSDARTLTPGLFFYGLQPANLPFLGGTLCVQEPLRRTEVFFTGGSGFDCTGTASLDMNAENVSALMFPANTDVYVQTWLRDPPGSFDTALSDGYAFTYGP